MKTIQQFADEHQACPEGVEWALENCKDLQEVWEKAYPEWLLWIATRKGVLTDSELRLFTVACAKQHFKDRVSNEILDRAIEVADLHARGECDDEQLSDAHKAALAQADEAYEYFSEKRMGERYEAVYGRQMPGKMSCILAADCAHPNVRKAAMLTHDATAPEFYANWLRENTKPNFEGQTAEKPVA